MRQSLITALAVVLSFCGAGHSQTSLGTYPFGAFDTPGADSINVGNLNVMLSVTILNKLGRAGDDLVYKLNYNGTIWSPPVYGAPLGSSWSPDSNWGWSGTATAQLGHITNTVTSSGRCVDTGGHGLVHWEDDANFVYYDPQGGAHSFPRTAEITLGTCTAHGNWNSFPAAASDASGYILNSDYTITTRDGKIITPYRGIVPAAGSSIDNNGNKIDTAANGSTIDTLGTAAVTVASVSPPTLTYTYLDTNTITTGTGQTITETYHSYSVRTAFGCTGISEYSQTSISLVDKITYPDGTYYAFTYEPTPGTTTGEVTGRLASVQLPAGGQISYAYSGANNGINCSDGTAEVITRLDSDGTRTYTRSGISPSVSSTDIAAGPSGAVHHTTYKFVLVSTASQVFFYNTRITVNPVSGTALLDTAICYNGNTTSCDTTVPSMPISEVATSSTFDGTSTNGRLVLLNSAGQTTRLNEYDFGSGGSIGSLLRSTITTYSTTSFPTSVEVDDASGNALSYTKYAYDGGTLTTTSGLPQHVSVSHARNNLTQITHCDTIACTGGGVRTTSYRYDDTGSILSVQFAPDSPTTLTYDTATNTFPVQITAPSTMANGSSISHISSASFDINSGLQISSVDQNSNSTKYCYDKMLRLQYVQNSSSATACNTSPVRKYLYTPPSFGPFVEATIEADVTHATGANIATTGSLDGYGRPHAAVLTDSSGNVTTEYSYDSQGRLSAVSTPHRASSTSTDGTTIYGYDALNRTVSKITKDGSGTTVSTNSLAPSGNAVITSDAAGHQRKIVYDGLGRVSVLWEPNGSGAFTYETDYLYQQNYSSSTYQFIVHQKGGSASSSDWHTRTSTYDMLDRVISETTPEAGTVTSAYLNSGSACAGNIRAVCVRADNMPTMTTYAYDGLDRTVAKTYSGTGAGAAVAANTPSVTYYYDESSHNGLSITNGIGNMTGMDDGSGSTAWSYDSMNRPFTIKKKINGHTLTSAITYNIDSTINTLTDFGGTTLAYSYDNAGRLTSITDGSGNSYAGSATYYPPSLLSGLAHQMSGGASYSRSNQYNSMLQPTVIAASRTSSPSATLMSYSIGYGATGNDNGNISAITDNANSGWNQTFTYDNLNRLYQATNPDTTHGTDWVQTYTYNPWGNLTAKSQTGSVIGASPTATETNNQLSTQSYDAAGRVLVDGSVTYTYDAEGRILTANSNSYVYDGKGYRVEKTVGGVSALDWPGVSGKIIDESNSSASTVAKQVYFGGMLVWRESVATGTGLFLFQDEVGSTRLTGDASGSIKDSVSYYPFGERISYSSVFSDNHYGFTGDEEDGDSDYARYRNLDTSWGRFNRLDPSDRSYNALNPQSLNRYSYVSNNPMTAVDPTGLRTTICSGAGCYSYSDTDWQSIISGSQGGLYVGSDGNIYTSDGNLVATTWWSPDPSGGGPIVPFRPLMPGDGTDGEGPALGPHYSNEDVCGADSALNNGLAIILDGASMFNPGEDGAGLVGAGGELAYNMGMSFVSTINSAMSDSAATTQGLIGTGLGLASWLHAPTAAAMKGVFSEAADSMMEDVGHGLGVISFVNDLVAAHKDYNDCLKELNGGH